MDDYDHLANLIETVSELSWGLSQIADGLKKQYEAGLSAESVARHLSDALLSSGGILALTKDQLQPYLPKQPELEQP